MRFIPPFFPYFRVRPTLQVNAMAGLDQSRFAKLENFQELAGRNASLAYLEAEAEAFK